MKQVEGEDPGQWHRQMLNNVHSLYFQTRGVNLATQMRTIALRDGRRRPTLPPNVFLLLADLMMRTISIYAFDSSS
jgi:hypothetical protein